MSPALLSARAPRERSFGRVAIVALVVFAFFLPLPQVAIPPDTGAWFGHGVPLNPHHPQAVPVPIATNVSATPSVQDLSKLVPSPAGGSWSQFTRILPLAANSYELLGADTATGLPKLGVLTAASSPPGFSDTTQGFTSQLNPTTTGALTGAAFDDGQLSSSPTIVYLWDAHFGQFASFPEIWTIDTATGAVSAIASPPSFTLLMGGASDGSSLLFVGLNASGSTPETLYSVYNATAGYTNVTGAIPASFGAAEYAIGTGSGFLLTSNQSGNTLGLLAFTGGTWKFTNLSTVLPTTSSFTSPAAPFAVNGADILLASYHHGFPGATPDAWGVLDLSTPSFANETANVLSGLGAPSAAAADPVTGVNFTLAAGAGLADLDGATGAVSKLVTRSPWNVSLVPSALEWTSTRSLVVAGSTPGGWGFLTVWNQTSGALRVGLPSGLVRAIATTSGNGLLAIAGTNGSAGAVALVNLTAPSALLLGDTLPVALGTITSSTFLGSTLYFTDGTYVVAYNTATSGPLTLLPTVPGRGFTNTLAAVNGSLWAGGTLFSGAAGLFQYSASSGSWTNLSSALATMSFGLGDIVPGAPGTALLGGISGNGTGDIWYFNASSTKLFENVTATLGPSPPSLSGQEGGGWNGTAFWVLNGSEVESWTPSQPALLSVFYTSPITIIGLSSLAVSPQGFALGGYGNESPSAPDVPVALIGSGANSRLDDLTPSIGRNWTGTPVTGIAGAKMVVAGENLSGQMTLAAVTPLLQGTIYGNGTVADAPATLHFTLQLSGGVSPYGTVHWTSAGKPNLAGPAATYVFNTSGLYQVNATATDASGATVLVQAIITVNPPLVLKLQASPTSGVSPLSVTIQWNLTGGAGAGYSVDLAFGDSTTDYGLGASGSVQHIYTSGTFTLLASGSDGVSTVTQSLPVNVAPTTPPVNLTSVAVSPSSISVKAGTSQAFTATPQCSSVCPVVNYSWGVTGHLGTLNATKGNSILFTAGSGTGNVTLYVNASLNGTVRRATAHIQVTAANGTPPGGGGGSGSSSGFLLEVAVIAIVIVVVVIAAVLVLLQRRGRLGKGPHTGSSAGAPAARRPPRSGRGWF